MKRRDDLVGYAYRADTYCGSDIGARLAREGWSICPAEVARVDGEPATAELAEAMLDELATIGWANSAPIDRECETTFDSDEFPKVIFRDQASDANAQCAVCGQVLADLPKIPTSVRS